MEAQAIQPLARLLRDHKGTTIVLTGAGISTESGIPDFRSPGGLYESIDPMEYLSVWALERTPARFWDYFARLFGSFGHIQPNAGHVALARLEAEGYVHTVVTQNIDGLHTRAGSANVLEVHGHVRTVHCTGCAHTFPMAEALRQVADGHCPPGCPRCGELLRPDVVLFGDMLSQAFPQAIEAARASSLTLVVGSSLTVSPANSIAVLSPHLAIINRDPTPADARADLVIHAPAGDTLAALLETLGIP